jgi:hypothetical protein
MVRIIKLVEELCRYIDDKRFNLEPKVTEEGVSFKASFYHDYYYVDKETRLYTNTELRFLETFCGAMLDDIAEATYYVFDCHALKSKITKEFLNELEEKISNGRN